MAGSGDLSGRVLDGRLGRQWAEGGADRHCAREFGELRGDVLRKLKVNGAGPLRLRNAKCIADKGGNVGAIENLARGLGERSHHRDGIDNLEPSLPAVTNRLLAGNHQHRHSAERGEGSSGDQVGSTWTQSAETYAWFAGEPAISGRHETSGLFVSRNHQPYGRCPQGLEKIKVLFAGNSEHIFDPFIFKSPDEDIGALDLCVSCSDSRGFQRSEGSRH